MVYPCHHAITITPPKLLDVVSRFRLFILPSPLCRRFGLRYSTYEATSVFTFVMA